MNQTPVCRSFSLVVIDNARFSPTRGQRITPVPVPTERMPVEFFLKAVLKNAKVEHLGRQDMARLEYGRANPSSLFFQGLHQAFAEHHPFALRPEVLLYLVNFNVAETVKRHPDDYRHLFTRNTSGKETIQINHNLLVRGDPASPWHEVFPMFNAGLREKVPAGIMEHMLPGFSTATAESDAASMVAFMDAASPFYDYRVRTLCGIPEIRLLGTPEDWKKLKTAAAMLAEPFAKHLGPYFENLLPVLSTLADQANGAHQDNEFWTSIYKWKSESGGPKFNGWIAAFLYYVQEEGKLGVKHDRHFNWKKSYGLPSGCAPAHVSSVPFVWNYLGADVPMQFVGGVLGLDVEDGYLTPALSYGVLEK